MKQSSSVRKSLTISCSSRLTRLVQEPTCFTFLDDIIIIIITADGRLHVNLTGECQRGAEMDRPGKAPMIPSSGLRIRPLIDLRFHGEEFSRVN